MKVAPSASLHQQRLCWVREKNGIAPCCACCVGGCRLEDAKARLQGMAELQEQLGATEEREQELGSLVASLKAENKQLSRR